MHSARADGAVDTAQAKKVIKSRGWLDSIFYEGNKLSKELKSLEEHQLIKRIVYDSVPVSIEYKLTSHAKTLDSVILYFKRLVSVAPYECYWQIK